MTNGKFAEGVTILAKYLAPEKYGARAEHDQLWIGGAADVSPEDAARLEDLGWFIDEEAWSCFV